MKKDKSLDAYEQELESSLEETSVLQKQQKMKNKLKAAAKDHLQKKKPITIRVSIEDLEAIKIKAAHCGIPYQTYLNMIIHRDASIK